MGWGESYGGLVGVCFLSAGTVDGEELLIVCD